MRGSCQHRSLLVSYTSMWTAAVDECKEWCNVLFPACFMMFKYGFEMSFPVRKNISIYRSFSAILSYLQKSEKKVFCFPLIFRIKTSLQMYCNRTIYFKTRVIKFKFCCNSMISQPLPNFKTQFSPKDEVGSYDNIEPNQRYNGMMK